MRYIGCSSMCEAMKVALNNLYIEYTGGNVK